ncbi:MAG: hypothetical protein RMJ14_00905 [Nitrososphaerota archaeon]|nr:hypothetical protein [Aigarchaeota archaeon]MDW8076186.1 hypothetical protein [Nitrososphaerota archaeon]
MDLKKLMTIAILIALVCTMLVQFNVIYSEEEKYEVVRSVEVKDGGLVYISDSIYIEPGKTAEVGFDITLKDNLVAFYTEQATIKVRYTEEEQLPSLFFIEMKNIGEKTVRANLVTVFKNLVVEEESKVFVANVPILPVLRKTVTSFYMVVRFPGGSKVELPERPGFNYTATMDGVFMEAKDVDLLSPTSISVKFKNDKFSILFVERAEVTFFVGNQRQVAFYLKIANHGKSSISEVKLLLPKDATLLNVKDSLGTLSYNYAQENRTLRVNTRWEVKGGEKVSFTVEYLEPRSKEPEGTYISSYPSLLDVAYGEYILKIVLPSGYEFIKSSPEPEEFVKDESGTTRLTYISKSIATLQPKSTININYVTGINFVSYLPYLWIATFAVLLTTIVTYKISRKPKAPPLPEELKESLKALTSSVLGMIRACEKLASSIPLDKKLVVKWSKSTYESELTSIRRDMDKIAALKKRFGGFPEITAKLSSLEVQITELLGIMVALGRTVEDFRLGRIGKTAYERITKEYTRDVSSLSSRVVDTTRDIEAYLK